MNKYLSKIVGAVASLAMVIGVGIGIASNKNVSGLHASSADLAFNGDFSGTYNSTPPTSVSWTSLLLNISQNRTQSETTPANNVTAPRWYQGNTITFTPVNCTITSMVLTWTNTYSRDDDTWSTGTASTNTETKKTTWTGSTSSSFTLIPGAQFRPTTIALTYTSGGNTPSLSSIAISNSLTKASYTTAENWDSSGLTVTGTYSNSDVADLTASATFTYYSDSAMTSAVATPNDLGVGTGKTVYVKATVSGISNATGYAQTVNISAPAYTNTTGYTNGGTYVIYDGTYYLRADDTNQPERVGSMISATPFVATLTANNTFSFINSEKYLYSTNTNNGVRFGATADSWLLEAETGGFTFKDVNNNRYLTSTDQTGTYANGDWRGYTNRNNGETVLTLVEYDPSVYLASIALSGSYPTEFTQGDEFSHQGMVVTATYSNSDTADVTSSATFSGYNMSGSGVQTVTVSYTANAVTKTATYDITVEAPIIATGISLNTTSAEIMVGGTTTLTATLIPNNSTSTYTWESSDESVAMVENGVVTGVAAGSATITAKVTEEIKASCSLTVTAVPEPTVLEKTLSQFLNVENNKTHAYLVTAEIKAFKTEATKDKYGNMTLTDGVNDIVIYGASMTASALVWNGINTYVFDNPEDFLTNNISNALAIGMSITMKLIRCDYNETKEGQGVITAIHASDISLNNSSVDVLVGGTTTLTANLTPIISTSSYTWESSDESVATVDNGVVTGVAAGSATITAKVTEDVKATCLVTVGTVATPNNYLYSSNSIATLHGKENRIVFADLGLSNDTQYSDPFVCGDFSVVFGGGGNNGKYFNTGSGIRLYSGGTITISSAYTISQISFAWSGGDDYKPSDNVANTGTYNQSTGVWSGSSTSVTLTRPSVSGQWRLQSIEVKLQNSSSYISSVAMRFGATIPQSDWNAIKEHDGWNIGDYGVMLMKASDLTAGSYSSVEDAFDKNASSSVLKDIHKCQNATPYADPYLDGENYIFTVKVSFLNDSQYFDDVIYAAPYIVVNDQYYFLTEMSESVQSLAGKSVSGVNTTLSSAALGILSGN